MTNPERLATLIHDGRRLSGDELGERAARAAGGLAALGVGPGDAVALLLRNDVAFVEATLALQRLGAYAVPLNWHAQADELAYVIDDCGAHVLIAHTDLITDALHARIADKAVLAVGSDAPAPPRAIDWAPWLARQAPWDGPPAAAPADTIIYTSGTTGHPKGVRRDPATPDQQRTTDLIRTEVYGLEPGCGARALMPAPLYHSAPSQFALRALRTGELLVLQARFDPAALLAAIERHRITHAYMVPTMFVRLLALPPATRERHDTTSLRNVVHVGAPCPPEVKQGVIDWLGPIVTDYYGSTEIGPVTVCTSSDWLAHPGSVGRPVTGAEIAILDDDGHPLATGQVGEICVANPGFPDFAYVNQPGARAALQRGRFVASGDLGHLDVDGFLYVCDRKTDMVICGGVNVYPAEVEAYLLALPGVIDCAVFGIPDDDLGEVLAAIVQPRPGSKLTPVQISEQLADRLPRYKRPRHVELRDDLPREQSGKIRKRVLRAPFWERSGRAI